MELFFNDLSLHGQFHGLTDFKVAINRLMAMRLVAKRHGREIQCARGVAQCSVTSELSMPQAVGSLGRDESRAVMQWLTKSGPFWADDKLHSNDDYFECDSELVTDTALAEAAYGNLEGRDRRLSSLTPSSWARTPLDVILNPGQPDSRLSPVVNYFNADELSSALSAAPALPQSWHELGEACVSRCTRLTFCADSFLPFRGQPFVPGAAEHMFLLLNTLDRFANCFDVNGERTPEGQNLYQDHFAKSKGWFTDSSDAEKSEFADALTFAHPTIAGEKLFCSWHAKVKTPQLRAHFSWPIRANEPVYVPYVGPKITKR